MTKKILLLGNPKKLKTRTRWMKIFVWMKMSTNRRKQQGGAMAFHKEDLHNNSRQCLR
jgi:hypothetical protein